MACLHTVAALCGRKLRRRDLLLLCLAVVLLLGMVTHGFMFANKIPNDDDLTYSSDLTGAGLEAGRYVLFFFWKLFSTLSVPWFNGILALVFLGVACYLICDTFDLRRVWQPLALGCVLTTFPMMVSLFTYMYEAHVFVLGILFAVAAPWAMARLRHGWLWATVFATLATGIYQVYIMLTVGMLLLFIMRRTMDAALDQDPQQGLYGWRLAFLCAGCAIGALVLYMVGAQLVTRVLGVTLNSYQGVSSMGAMDIATLPQKIGIAYQDVWDYFVADQPSYTTKMMALVQWGLLVLGLCSVATGVVRCVRRKRFAQAALLVVCMACLPLAAEGIYFMGDEIVIHDLTKYPLIVFLLMPLVLLPCALQGLRSARVPLKRLCATALMSLYLVYGFSFCVLGNQAYYRMHMAFTRAEHFVSRMAARIESMEDYRPGIRMVSVGYLNHEESLIFFEADIADRFLPFVGVRNEVDYLWPNLTPLMLTRIVGLSVTPDFSWQPTQAEQAFVDAMPCYPAEGSIAVYEDLLIVKLS